MKIRKYLHQLSQPKWWNYTRNILKQEKYFHFNKFRLSQTNHDLLKYKNSKKALENYVKERKLQMIEKEKELLFNCEKQNEVWQCVKGFKRCDNSNSIKPNEWFENFNLSLNSRNQICDEFIDIGENYDENNIYEYELMNEFLNCSIVSEEIAQAIKLMKNDKSSGTDGMIVEMYKNGLMQVVSFSVTLFNVIFDTSVFPSQWCEAIILSIYKAGNKCDPANYRGISLLNILGKIFTKILNNRFVHWAEYMGK